ncbi:MAG: methyltransferase [Candidatus Micrarchaeota archaeon]|nr:methyltransferase [Candidatus Micrarchaeota archaeon]MDE1857289.1 methyltransferase [Candidatus Micrarchaeota archaeon]
MANPMTLLDGLKMEYSNKVYTPAEDSDLLARAVEHHAFGRVLDLGTGSGIQGIIAAMKGCEVTFADINPDALELARRNADLNGVPGTFVRTNLFSRVKGKFNTIIFNPPYVPSAPLAKGRMNIHSVVKPFRRLDINRPKRIYPALDGGTRGREVIDRFLSQYGKHLLKAHIVLMVESSFNGYKKDVKRLNAEIVGHSHYFFEDLVVLKFR